MITVLCLGIGLGVVLCAPFVACTTFDYFFHLRNSRGKQEVISKLATLSSEDVENITFRSENRKILYKVIDDNTAINSFLISMNKLESSSLNHPRSFGHMYVSVLTDAGDTLEFKFWFDLKSPDELFVSYIDSNGLGGLLTSHYGIAKSNSLQAWILEQNVIPPETKEILSTIK